MPTIGTEDPVGHAAVAAIHAGDGEAVRRLLDEHPGLATARLGNPPAGSDPGMTWSLLHVVTDWPGHYPNGAAMVTFLVRAGAEVNARFTGPSRDSAALGGQQRRHQLDLDLGQPDPPRRRPPDGADDVAAWLVSRGGKPAAELRAEE